MPTQEQIDAFNELDRRGYFKDKDPTVVGELRKRFNQDTTSAPDTTAQDPIRKVMEPGGDGAYTEVLPPKPSRYDVFYPDKGQPVDLKAPIIKKFIPDLPSGANAPQAPVDLAGEALNEEAAKYLKSNLDALTFGVHFGEKDTKAIEQATGIPREQKVPFWQDIAATGALNIGQGEGIGTLFKSTVGRTALGKFLLRPIWESKATQVAADAVDKLAPQEVKDQAAKLAARSPEDITKDLVTTATKTSDVIDASQSRLLFLEKQKASLIKQLGNPTSDPVAVTKQLDAVKEKLFEMQKVLTSPEQSVAETAQKIGQEGMPTTAQPLGEMTGAKAGAINLDYLNTPDKVKMAIEDMAKQAPKVFKGDTVPVQDMIDAAQDVGMTEADILSGKLKPDTALHPKILAARQIMLKAQEDMAAVKDRLLSPEATQEDLVNFKVAFEKARDITKYVRSSVSEIARTLRSQQIAVGSQEYRQKAMQEIMKSMEGRQVTEEIAKRFASIDVNNPREVAMFVREMTPATTMDKVFEGWRNFLLSGTLTPVRNAIGNTMAILTRGAEKVAAPVIDIGRALVTGTPRERFFSELPAEVQAHTFGVWDGLKNARVAFQQELPIFGFDKFQEAAQATANKGAFGKIIRIPQRMAMSADEIYKTVLYEGQLASEAFRQATKEGLKGAAFTDRLAQLKLAPTEEMVNSAQNVAQHFTFQDPLGPIGKWMSQGRRTVPGMRYLLPFIQVSANIPKWSLQRTPLYLPWIGKKVVEGELVGGAISDELAKVAVGSLASVPIFQHVMEGNITGNGPINPGERNVWLKTHQPYSIRVGNKWYQMKNVDPAGWLLGAVGDFKDVWDRMDQQGAATALAIAIAKNSTNSTYMTSLRNVIDAVTDPERNGNKFLTQFVGGVVPNLVATTQRAIDPKLYRPNTVLQALQSRIPFIDKTDLPPVLDIWGRPVIREGTFASRMFWPVATQTIPDDPATQEVARLKMSISSPAKKVENIPLNPHQYLFYAQYSGQEAQRIVNLIIQNPNYQQLSDSHKENAIEQAFSTARDKAKAYLLQNQPDLVKEIIAYKKKKATE